MARIRLDQLLVSRGLAPSRKRAHALILAGDVTVAGAPAAKAGQMVDAEADVALRRPDHPWVSRGGVKLSHALQTFAIDVGGLTVLDIGASAGGFTDVLLARGASRVVALDVGHAQLDWKLRTDPRVVCLEGVNARYLTADALPSGARSFDLITIDVAFISLGHIFPVLPALLAPGGRVLALVKPQFEAGRADVGPGGIVRDPDVHARVLDATAAAAHQVGLEPIATTVSPIEGTRGNREFFMLFRAADRR